MFCYCLLFLFEFLALRAVISYFICITHHASHHPTFHRRLLGVGGSKLYCLLQFVLRMLAVSLPACFRFEIYTVWTCRLWPFFRSTLFMLSVPISSHTHTHLIYVIALCSEHILTPERNGGKESYYSTRCNRFILGAMAVLLSQSTHLEHSAEAFLPCIQHAVCFI